MNSAFNTAYERWQQACLAEYNARYGESRILLHHAPDDYRPGDVIEFAEDGNAYPHGAAGTNYIPSAVTPWAKSEHHVE